MSEKWLRVTRTLVYEGPAEAVENWLLAKPALQPGVYDWRLPAKLYVSEPVREIIDKPVEVEG